MRLAAGQNYGPPIRGYRTNRIIGGVAPSKYLAKLEQGSTDANGRIVDPPIEPAVLDGYLLSHCIPVTAIRDDDFESFMTERRKMLLRLIANATGHAVSEEGASPDEGEELSTEMERGRG